MRTPAPERKITIRRRSLLILALLLAAGCAIVFRSYIWGDETLVFGDGASDTKQQYIMWFNDLACRIRTGTFSLWNFNHGLGVNEFILNLTNPLLNLVYLSGAILHESRLAKLMVWWYMLQIILSGLTCYLFLSVYRFREDAKVLTAFMYAFCSYMLLWGQHYSFGTEVAALPLLALTAEMALNSVVWCFLMALACALTVLNTFYMGYMSLLALGLYLLIRVLLYEGGRFGERLRLLIRQGLFMLLGAALAAINLLPSAMAVTNSGRVSSEGLLERLAAGLALWDRPGYYRTAFLRLFGSNLQGVDAYYSGYKNYYEGVELFMGVLCLFMMVQYLCTIHRQPGRVRQKAAQYLGAALCVFIVVIRTGSLIFNGFSYEITRECFVFLPLMAAVTAGELTKILEERRVCLPALGLTVAACLCAYLSAYHETALGYVRTLSLVLLAGSLLMALVLLLIGRGILAARTGALLLAVLVFATQIADAQQCFAGRDSVKKSDANYFENTYVSNTNRALAYLAEEDGGFCRIEKDFETASNYLEALAQHYHGVSTYDAVRTPGISKFYARMWTQMFPGNDNNHLYFGNTVHEQGMASLVGVKYLLSHSDVPPASHYELIHQEGEVYIYRNTETENVAHFYQKTISRAQYYNHRAELDTEALVREVLVVTGDTQWSLDETDEEFLEEYKRREVTGILTADYAAEELTGTCTISFDPEALAQYDCAAVQLSITVPRGLMLYMSFDDGRTLHYWHNGERTYTIDIPQGASSLTIRLADESQSYSVNSVRTFGRAEDTQYSDEAEITVQLGETDDHVTGTISAASPGLVMLSIPNQDGWELTVDGEPAEWIDGDYGFIAFETGSGEHTFELIYRAPGFTAGLIVSGAALLVWFAGIWLAVRAADQADPDPSAAGE